MEEEEERCCCNIHTRTKLKFKVWLHTPASTEVRLSPSSQVNAWHQANLQTWAAAAVDASSPPAPPAFL